MSQRPLALTTDPIAQLTWRIALPASAGMFFNTLFNFVDTWCAVLQHRCWINCCFVK